MDKFIWKIEIKDRNLSDSLMTEAGRKARKSAFQQGAMVTVGCSEPSRDFPFVLSAPTEGCHKTEIVFLVGFPPMDGSNVVLELDVIDIGRGNPYDVNILLNGQLFSQRIPEITDAKGAGVRRTFSFKLPALAFKQGVNILTIRNNWGFEDLVLGRAAMRTGGDIALAPMSDKALRTIEEELAVIKERRESECAEIEARLSEWFTPSRIGLFLHWGLGTTPGFKTVEEFDRAVAAGGWSASKWVEEAKRIRAGYITLASFHSCLGFIRPWKSAIPGTPLTGRDYLGELIYAARAEGIKVVVYITTSAPGDVEAYREYARRRHPHLTAAQIESSFTLGTGFGGGAFIFDIVEELCQNYDIAGLWFDAFHNPTWYEADSYPWADGWAYDKKNRYDKSAFATKYFYHRDMVRFVRRLNPRLVTFVNYFPPILESADVRGHEFDDKEKWKICPVSGPMPVGEENLLVPSGDWWFNGECPEFSFQREIRRIVHTIGCGCVAGISEGPFIGGDLPQPLIGFNEFFSKFLAWAGESLLDDTIAGGRGKGGFASGEWDNGAYGVATFNSVSNTHYLHVLTGPSGNSLTLSDSGITVKSATVLKTSLPLPFKQEKGKLSLEVSDWNSLAADGDFIIKLRC